MQRAFVCLSYPLFLPLIHSTAASLALLLTVPSVGQRSTSFLEFKTMTTSRKVILGVVQLQNLFLFLCPLIPKENFFTSFAILWSYFFILIQINCYHKLILVWQKESTLGHFAQKILSCPNCQNQEHTAIPSQDKMEDKRPPKRHWHTPLSQHVLL